MQETIITDATAHVILNIWENHIGCIGKVKEGCSYG